MRTPKLASPLSAVLLGALAVTACSKKKEPPPDTTKPATAADAGTSAARDAAAAAPAAPKPAPLWTRGTSKVEVLCGELAEATGSYGEALKAGRKEANKKNWLEAIAAFQQALRQKPDDAAALSELSVALLQVGDAGEALLAGELAAKQAGQAGDAKLQAASYFNAGRAAEALGDLDKARQHYEAELALRENETVRARLQALVAPPLKAIGKAAVLSACQGQESLAAVCDCLAKSGPTWGKDFGVTAEASCAPVEKQGGERGAVLAVQKKAAVPEELVPGEVLVLAAKRGEKWSALRLMEEAEEVDLTEMPRASSGATVEKYEELPIAGGTLLWVQSFHRAMETQTGETDSEGEAHLNLCALPDDATKPASCSELSLGVWSVSYEPERGDQKEKCEDRLLSTYRAVLDSSGVGSLIFAGGRDELRQRGRFQVKLSP